ncbi:MAG: methylenetetrahydrofolate--tRNA-(uracil(54)-C(5))-methyltransferase (FADH(2)-oxidizing) TrmFO [Vulcanimicrobiaceae bacterium]
MPVSRLMVIGAGLAGCEAAWQAARLGVGIDLYEMRPHCRGPAHAGDRLAELVCSNSLRGVALENAVGLLKEELARLDSLIVTSARESAVPAGGALAVDREQFAATVEERIAAHPQITLHREEVQQIPLDRATIVACGPLPSDTLLAAIDAVLAQSHIAQSVGPAPARLHYYDAASPIVDAESIDESPMYRKSRYDKGDGDDYLNIPLSREQYGVLLHDLRTLPRHRPKAFEAQPADRRIAYFEGCLPIEEMADRGDEVLRYGPLKPVGLRDPRTGATPYAVVQLRKENVSGTAYNLVGFQTRLTWPAQKEAFAKLPGLGRAQWLRLGVMHRNTFLDAPRLLDERLQLRGQEALWFAGQITGAEGYVEAAACGWMAGTHAARALLGMPPATVPSESALGAVVAHLQNRQTSDFQPSNVTWAFFPPLAAGAGRLGKRERHRAMAERALASIERFVRGLASDESPGATFAQAQR